MSAQGVSPLPAFMAAMEALASLAANAAQACVAMASWANNTTAAAKPAVILRLWRVKAIDLSYRKAPAPVPTRR
jgi:hypothetical protein